MFDRVQIWWTLAVRSAASLTAPATPASNIDDDITRLLRSSELGNAAARTAAAVDRMWRHAMLRRLSRRFADPWTATAKWERTQTLGWIAAVSGATALVAQSLKPVPVGPLSWIVPFLMLTLGLLVTAAVRVIRPTSNES